MATAMNYEDVITWVSSNQSVEKLNDIAQLAFDRSKVLARRSKDQWQPNMPVHFVQSDGEVMNGHVRAGRPKGERNDAVALVTTVVIKTERTVNPVCLQPR